MLIRAAEEETRAKKVEESVRGLLCIEASQERPHW